uniref:Uncharacterized protein n=1 Tax=Candidatus Kentrum sp. DK TaxID=2126562 RepID=A0A450TD28_9GAMM|nr:MAG: hypothetical protein BECKDK2373B_GA0170837_11404 [Candidatus Kentron sp. DK]
MTKKYTALAMAGTPITPCGTTRLLVRDEESGKVSTLTPQGPSPRSVSPDEFHRLEQEGFSTSFPQEEPVKEGWYVLYLKEELADELGGFPRSLAALPEPDRGTDGMARFIRIPETPYDAKRDGCVAILGAKRDGCVVILGANELLWRLRKNWCASLSKSNRESNLDYLETPKADLLDIIEKRARLGIYCAEPEITPEFHKGFARELGLVMKRHSDRDARYRVYKYQIKPYFPSTSWNRFEKEVITLEEEYQRELLKRKAGGKTLQEIRIEERTLNARWGRYALGTA